jgi:hypothetical protein
MRARTPAFAAIIVTFFFLLALIESRYGAAAFGQAAGANPAPPMVTLPAAPGQPQAFATIGALPALAPAPGPKRFAQPTATPGMQSFRCSCNGPGFPTSWVGNVQASNMLIAAQQTAPSQCVSYRTDANAENPQIGLPSSFLSSLAPSSRVPGTLYSFPPGTPPPYIPPTARTHPPLSSIQGQLIAAACSRCSCD